MTFVTCYLQGGLGNQLFIIFATISAAIKSKCSYVIINQQDSPSITERGTYFNTLLSKLKTEDMYKEAIRGIVREKDHMVYEEIPLITANTMLHGYFQSRKYIDPIRQFILDTLSLGNKETNMLKATKEIINEKSTKNGVKRKCVFIHVRRGDYIKLSDYHYNIPTTYYQQAIEEQRKKNPDCFFVVFSDDIEYCKKEFEEIIGKDDIYYVNLSKEYVELMLMSEMDGAIIPNSTFSWWGAYLMETRKELNNKESPFIVSPKRWFTKDPDNIKNDRNVERHNWMFL